MELKRISLDLIERCKSKGTRSELLFVVAAVLGDCFLFREFERDDASAADHPSAVTEHKPRKAQPPASKPIQNPSALARIIAQAIRDSQPPRMVAGDAALERMDDILRDCNIRTFMSMGDRYEQFKRAIVDDEGNTLAYFDISLDGCTLYDTHMREDGTNQEGDSYNLEYLSGIAVFHPWNDLDEQNGILDIENLIFMDPDGVFLGEVSETAVFFYDENSKQLLKLPYDYAAQLEEYYNHHRGTFFCESNAPDFVYFTPDQQTEP